MIDTAWRRRLVLVGQDGEGARLRLECLLDEGYVIPNLNSLNRCIIGPRIHYTKTYTIHI